jgi:hypothetical protein
MPCRSVRTRCDRAPIRSARYLALSSSLLLGLAAPALAVDGVIEINQAKALAGGVTATDSAGFPVTIDASGSYRLTGSLSVSADQHGIVVSADDVTLDLGGFSIVAGGGTLLRSGVSVGSSQRVEIENGSIRGFTQHGVEANGVSVGTRLLGLRASGNSSLGFSLPGYASLVDGCIATNNGTDGIRVGPGSLVINSLARQNGGFGLRISGAGYRSNVFIENNNGNPNPQVAALSDSEELGTNYCGTDTICP